MPHLQVSRLLSLLGPLQASPRLDVHLNDAQRHYEQQQVSLDAQSLLIHNPAKLLAVYGNPPALPDVLSKDKPTKPVTRLTQHQLGYAFHDFNHTCSSLRHQGLEFNRAICASLVCLQLGTFCKLLF